MSPRGHATEHQNPPSAANTDRDGDTVMRTQLVYGAAFSLASSCHAVSDISAVKPVSVWTYIDTLGPGTDRNYLDAHHLEHMDVDGQNAFLSDRRVLRT